MNPFGTYRAELAARLEQVAPDGVLVTTNPAGLAPMILVAEADDGGAVGVGGWSVTIAIKCIAPPPGDAVAVELCEDMLYEVLAVVPGRWQWGTYRPSADVSMPMVELLHTCTIPNPRC